MARLSTAMLSSVVLSFIGVGSGVEVSCGKDMALQLSCDECGSYCGGACERDTDRGLCRLKHSPVLCGGHIAGTCDACTESVKKKPPHCNGHCHWDKALNKCMKTAGDVDCGNHNADSCQNCIPNQAKGVEKKAFCNGSCRWDEKGQQCTEPVVEQHVGNHGQHDGHSEQHHGEQEQPDGVDTWMYMLSTTCLAVMGAFAYFRNSTRTSKKGAVGKPQDTTIATGKQQGAFSLAKSSSRLPQSPLPQDDRNLPGLTSLDIPGYAVDGPVRINPQDGRYYTLAQMIAVNDDQYTKKESEDYWNNSCTAPRAESPPPPSADWFSKLFGFSEVSYAEARRWLKVLPDEHGGGQRLISTVNTVPYAIGRFGTPRLDTMRAKVAEFKLPGRLTVSNELGDVAEKHSAAENRHATFQVASQFNCLEFVGPNVVPEDGVTGYVQDRTQGPACSIACGPATIFRNYFARMPAEDNGLPEQYGQTRDRMIDNLSDVSEVLSNIRESMYKVQGGYTQADEAGLQALDASLAQLRADGRDDLVRAALRVGVHEDAQVTSAEWGQKVLSDPGQTVTQVFGSACAVAYSAGTQPKSWEQFASVVLEASYEATLCAALLAAQRHPGQPGARRVFLTSLGGGVFGNPMEWIVAAIRRACDRYKDYNLDVRIVTYAGEVHALLQELARDFQPQAAS